MYINKYIYIYIYIELFPPTGDHRALWSLIMVWLPWSEGCRPEFFPIWGGPGRGLDLGGSQGGEGAFLLLWRVPASISPYLTGAGWHFSFGRCASPRGFWESPRVAVGASGGAFLPPWGVPADISQYLRGARRHVRRCSVQYECIIIVYMPPRQRDSFTLRS